MTGERVGRGIQAVVVTGASSGVGRETALEFARRGVNVALVARDEDALRAVQAECDGQGGEAVVAAADVTDLAAMEKVARLCQQRFGRLDAWVNSAVVAAYGDFGVLPLEHFRRVIDVALYGTVHGALAALPYFRAQQRGVLINIASVLGTLGIPHMASYVAAKHAVVGFSEGLRQELSGSGIEVCVVLPGTIATPFYEHAGNYTGSVVRPVPPVMRPEVVARRIVEVAFRPRKQTFVPRSGALVAAARATLPNVTEKLSRAIIDRVQISNTPAAPTAGNLYRPAGPKAVKGEGKGAAATAALAGGIAAALGAWLLSRPRPAVSRRRAA
jgi:short-subunit dehydrogenase